MVSKVVVIRDNTGTSKNLTENSFFATVGVERICVKKRRNIYWFHIICHCYGLQASKNGILYTNSGIS